MIRSNALVAALAASLLLGSVSLGCRPMQPTLQTSQVTPKPPEPPKPPPPPVPVPQPRPGPNPPPPPPPEAP
jgi:hypothetical protein